MWVDRRACGWSRSWLMLAAICDRRPLAVRLWAGGPTDLAHASIMRRPSAGRAALTLKGFLKPEWSESVYRNAARLWDQPAPDPDEDPLGYAAVFRYRYGLHPATLSQRRAADGLCARARPRRREDRPADRLHGLPRRLDRRSELRRARATPNSTEGPAVRADDGRRQATAVFHIRAQLVARDQQRRPDRRGAPEPAQHRSLGPFVSRCRWRSISPRWTRLPGGT